MTCNKIKTRSLVSATNIKLRQNRNSPNARLKGERAPNGFKSPKSYQNGSWVKADAADRGFNKLLKLLYGANPGRKIGFPFNEMS